MGYHDKTLFLKQIKHNKLNTFHAYNRQWIIFRLPMTHIEIKIKTIKFMTKIIEIKRTVTSILKLNVITTHLILHFVTVQFALIII